NALLVAGLGSTECRGVKAVAISTVSVVAVMVVKSALTGSVSMSSKYCLLIFSHPDLAHQLLWRSCSDFRSHIDEIIDVKNGRTHTLKDRRIRSEHRSCASKFYSIAQFVG